MGKTIKSHKSKPDITMGMSDKLQNMLENNGWTKEEMTSSTHHKNLDKKEGFVIFTRIVNNPRFSPSTILSKTAGVQRTQKIGAIKGKDDDPTDTGSMPLWGVPIATVTPPTGGGTAAMGTKTGSGSRLPSLDMIQTIQDMRCEDPSFCLGFDSEFYYDSNGQRFVLSWQFSFVLPQTPSSVVQLLIFAKDLTFTDSNGCVHVSRKANLLRFSKIINFIIERYDLFNYFGCGSSYGVSYYSTRRWRVPVLKRSGVVGSKTFASYNDAVKACIDPDVKAALIKAGCSVKAPFVYVDDNGRFEVRPQKPVNGYAIGYINEYTESNKHALPVTLICHTGSADITTLDFSDAYEKDMMLRLSQVQGGLVTLQDYIIHSPVLGCYSNFYPVRVSVRDTMCFAPAGSKKLADLGVIINVPKLDVPSPYSKSDMLSYMCGDVVGFSEYAINDAVIALLYCHDLWGCNQSMPVTVSSAAGKAAVPVISEYFGLSRDDKAGFNSKYRGLKHVKRGLVKTSSLFGYIQNSSLEPLNSEAELLQLYAKNAYKGGYNGSMKIGYFPDTTYDYDLKNAYPTCMVLVPDIDWDNCIALEVKNQPLSPMMVRSPFDPVFAVVDFHFPVSVRFPCIPQSVNGSMIFARDGKGVYASAPELYLALKLGAEIHVNRLFIGNIKTTSDGKPSHCLSAVVKQFVLDRDLAKKLYGKGSVPDLLVKLALVSLYGKTAQDVIDKSTWSAWRSAMVDIGGSAITSPVHACLTTAGVRAVLLATMNQLSDLGYDVFSVTTDGFISNVPEDVLNSLDLFGFSALMQSARTFLVGNPQVWEIKHEQDDLVNLTTRGNASLNDGVGRSHPGVLAHNSFVTGEVKNSLADRVAFVTAVLDRMGRVKCVGTSFALFKDMAARGIENRIDFCTTEQERALSMDFDLKRKPIESSFYTAYPVVQGVQKEIACFDTEPYDTISDYERYKKVGRGCTVLRTCADWSVFFNRVAGSSSPLVTDVDWSKLVSAVMACRLKVPLNFLGGASVSIPVLDSSRVSVSAKILWLSGFNASKKKFTVSTWKNCRRQDRVSQMLPEALYKDLLLDMLAWKPSVGSPMSAEVDDWSVVCNELFPVD